jgi:DNA-binding FadR family transcriptional regulator
VIRPPSVRLSHAEVLARRIEDEIVAARWPLGAVLGTETELSERYGVGRSVLRETARVLESHGVARRRPGPGGGLIVTRPEGRAILDATRLFLDFRAVTPADLYETWRVLEVVAVRRLAETVDAAGIQRLRDVLTEEDFRAGRDAADLPNLHVEVARLAGNPAVELFLLTVLGVARAQGRSSLRPAQVTWLRRRHADLVEAIARRDAMLAEQIFLDYIDQVAAENTIPDAAEDEIQRREIDDVAGAVLK